MKQLKIIFYLIIYLSILSCRSLDASLQNSQNSKDDQKIIATYLGGVVKIIDVKIEMEKIIAKNNKLKNLKFESLNSELQKVIIQEVVINKLASKKARQNGLDKHPDYQMAINLFENELLKQKLFIEIANKVKSEENIKKNYQELVKKLQNKKDYRLSYIALKTQNQANEIYETLNKNSKKFSDLAKKESLDLESGKKGGDLGFVIEDALPSEIVNAIKKLKKGQITKPILSSNRFVIAKFVDERKAEILPYSKAKEVLTSNLVKKALEDFSREILNEADIKIKN
jgi:parvulin-like peptidyl-prolyl isomerase